MKNTLFLTITVAALALPSAAFADHHEEPAEGSKEAAEQEKDEAKDEAKDATEAAKEGTKEAAEAAKNATEDAAETAAEAVEDAAEAVEEAAPASAEEAVEAVEAAAEAAPAEAAPAEETENKPDIDLVAEAAATWLHGNTKSITANGGIHFGITHDSNKFGLNFGGSYGQGVVPGAEDLGFQEIAKRVGGDLRYDRFLIPDVNSIYVGGGAMHDPLAGFLVQARGDVGYAHQLVNTPKHSLALEGGFNYSRDQFMPAPIGVGGGQNFFGGRVAGAYALNVNDVFGFTQSVEALLGGRENQDAPDPTGFDGRIVSDTGISANISKIFAIKWGLKLTYDFVPPVKADGTSFEPFDSQMGLALVATLM